MLQKNIIISAGLHLPYALQSLSKGYCVLVVLSEGLAPDGHGSLQEVHCLPVVALWGLG